MKLKHLGIFLLLSTMAVFSACSDDDDDKDDLKDNLATAVEGSYDGLLSVALENGDPEVAPNTILLNATAKDEIQLELKEFSMGEGAITVKDIKLNKIALQGELNNVKLVENKQEITIMLGSQEIKADVITNGTVKDGDLNLNLDIKATGLKITVTFKGEVSDLAPAVKGNYFGPLSVVVAETEVPASSNIINLKRTGINEIALELKEFSMEEAGSKITVSDIILDKITLEGENGNVTLKENTQTIKIKLGDADIDAKIKTNGTIKGDKLDLDLDINATGLKISVTFTGDKVGEIASILYDMEEWEVEHSYIDEDEPENSRTLYAPAPKESWGTSSKGTLLAVQKGNVTKSEKAEAYAGNAAAKLQTLGLDPESSKGNLMPLVMPGSLFNGFFKLTNILKPLTSSHFGVDFVGRPISISGYYNYKAGEIFYRVPEGGKKGEPIVEEGTTDKCAIGGILYDISSDDNYITGENTYTDSRIIAKGLFVGEVTKDYEDFSVKLEYLEGKTYDPSKKYRFAFITSSSAEGDTFSGAPGSTLFLDNIEIKYIKD